MSRGHCGRCKKDTEDENTIIYKYTCYNLDSDNWHKDAEEFDGSIYIEKDSFNNYE